MKRMLNINISTYFNHSNQCFYYRNSDGLTPSDYVTTFGGLLSTLPLGFQAISERSKALFFRTFATSSMTLGTWVETGLRHDRRHGGKILVKSLRLLYILLFNNISTCIAFQYHGKHMETLGHVWKPSIVGGGPT